jgi:hypothetical protein
MRLRVWLLLLLKVEEGCGEAFDIRQMPAKAAKFGSSANGRRRRGDVPEAAFRVRLINQNPNKTLFLIYLITRRLHLVKSLQKFGRQPTSDIRHTAIMADNQEELIMQFVELTGTSPGKVKSTSPNYFVSCQLTLSRHSNILEQTDGILIAQSLNTSRV